MAANLSPARLQRLATAMQGYVDRREVSGVVTALCRRGEVHLDAYGCQDAEKGTPMRRDSLFRIASMTKPILAVAALGLVEEGRIRLDEPIQRWLPELADRRVLRTIESPLDDTVPADRPITLRDLLTLRLGIGMVPAEPGQYPIQEAIAAAGLEPDFSTPPLPPDEWLKRLGSLPLAYQPGERWMYHTGYDVLAVLLARITGQGLGTVLAERIFDPLGMTDTGFSVPATAIDRLTACYRGNDVTDPGPDGPWSRPAIFPSELVSSAADYLTFARMLLAHGRHLDGRILARPTIELMTTDHITPEQKAVSGFFPGFWDNQGWGFGVSIVNRRTSISMVPGRYGWGGGFGTSFTVDPHEDFVTIVLIQREHDGVVGRLHSDFLTLAYQAIDD
jgi:CubicO group peptidase (beta-lactamase class C family)